MFLCIAKFQIYTPIYSFVRSPLQLCFFVFLPVSDPRGVSYATCCSCMAYSWKSSSKIFNRPIFLLHLFRLRRVFFAISSSLSSSSFSNSSRFRSPHLRISPRLSLCTFRSFFSIRRILSTFCLPFEIYSSNLFINTERESFLYLLFQLDRFVQQINEKCFILATFILSS